MSTNRWMDEQIVLYPYSGALFINKKEWSGDFPGDVVAETPCSQCRGPGFDPWSGSWISHATTKTWCSQINKYKKNNPFFMSFHNFQMFSNSLTLMKQKWSNN